ncbi:helitron helicase-like domain-containing protein [Nocardia sp. NRRL WC-3656]|uniref:helitron helicase-like domain-containing protein n=1 Tax=Nocardia sp. NRRL WC-3656 TaxID=1463824 RepID=UPI000A49B877|nr:helitron helicase-like domain-containing protein [Nocardia sp. NRRL WC-3656]
MTASALETTPESPVTDGDGATPRETAADRRARLNLVELAQASAEKFDVCRRPLPMIGFDQATGEPKYVGAPCKSTLECVCPACAAKARALRIQQAREGWHIEEEPVIEKNPPTQRQTELLIERGRLIDDYAAAKECDATETMDALREVFEEIDAELRESGIRGKLPGLDPEPEKETRKRSTRRRQAAPDLPRKKVQKTTIGRQYAGKYRPSMFITLTLPSYGKVYGPGHPDAGAPIDPDNYDYRQAARDALHFAALFDRFVQNYRRVTGRDVQYFATVEPQKRGAPHIHIAVRGSDSREVIRQLVAATYHQVWWPHFDEPVYTDRLPFWDYSAGRFVDPDRVDPETGQRVPVPTWDEALDVMDCVDDLEPAHVVRFGAQIDVKGILGGTEEAGRHIGYLTKYLTKSIGDVIEAQSQRVADHYDRLHAELAITPCSPSCGLWFRYGVIPKGATAKTVPGVCKGKAHRRDTLGMRGRRVLVSRKWTGKDLADHKADRVEFVRQRLAEAGISKPQLDRMIIRPVEPGDPNVPPREHLIMSMIAQKTSRQAEYLRAQIAHSERMAAEAESQVPQQGSTNDTAA